MKRDHVKVRVPQKKECPKCGMLRLVMTIDAYERNGVDHAKIQERCEICSYRRRYMTTAVEVILALPRRHPYMPDEHAEPEDENDER